MSQPTPSEDITRRRFVLFLLIVVVDGAAAVLVIFEVLQYSKAELGGSDIVSLIVNRGFDFAIIVSLLLFEFYIGKHAWEYLSEEISRNHQTKLE